MQFDHGYLSPYFVADTARMECVLEEAFILLSEKRLKSLEEFVPLLEQIAKAGRPLLVIAEDVGDRSHQGGPPDPGARNLGGRHPATGGGHGHRGTGEEPVLGESDAGRLTRRLASRSRSSRIRSSRVPNCLASAGGERRPLVTRKRRRPKNLAVPGPSKKIRQRPTLPRGFPRSTIGSGGLNFRVRDGNGCDPSDIATGKLLECGRPLRAGHFRKCIRRVDFNLNQEIS